MNAGSLLRFGLIFLSGLLLFMWMGQSDSTVELQPIQQPAVQTPETRDGYAFCRLETDLFRAELTTRGATLRHFELLSKKYRRGGKSHDLSTTPQPGVQPGTPQEMDPSWPGDHEFRQQLFAQFRNVTSPGLPGGDQTPAWNVDYDSVDWKLAEATPSRCDFRYESDSVRLTKVVQTSERAYELDVRLTIDNLASEPKMHALAVDTVAWWLDEEVASAMFRVSPYITHTECLFEAAAPVRLLPQDFEPDDFEAPEFAHAGGYGWYQPASPPAVAAVSNAYFSHALVPLDAAQAPVCQLQIEYRRTQGNPPLPAPNPGAYYRARLAYPATSLEPGASAEYRLLSYIGPKERTVLASAAEGKHHLDKLIDLGFFSWIAQGLVWFLLYVYGLIPNWGVAIIILTICARVLLFPAAVPGIRTMIKMRELKPEMDKLTEKYGDDMRAKGVAQMELWRKHGMTPFDQMKGCFPQLATMPVWFALYTTLQTAVELYNIPFLWFPDLSEPDPYFILPFIIGATYFLQQKIMPFQGDAAQRKMMMYFMPAMFTAFMLFLPSGLGVYMFTNSVLAILQQQVVESHAKKVATKGKVSVTEKDTEGGDATEGEKESKRSKRNRRRQEAS
jgi:YidC/Oxa1 family membrane protein insertase